MEGSAEPTVCVVFTPRQPEQVRNAIRIVDRFIALNCALLNWSRKSRNGRSAMQVHLSIGENHRFELHEALLIYRDRQSSFITRHDVIASKNAPPTLGPHSRSP